MLGHRERDRRQPRHYVISLYLAVVIAAHALALLVCSMCSPLMAVGILLNLRVNAVFPLYWRNSFRKAMHMSCDHYVVALVGSCLNIRSF